MRKLTLLAKELFMIVVLMRFIDQTVAIIALVGKMRPLLLVANMATPGPHTER